MIGRQTWNARKSKYIFHRIPKHCTVSKIMTVSDYEKSPSVTAITGRPQRKINFKNIDLFIICLLIQKPWTKAKNNLTNYVVRVIIPII